MTQPNNNNRHFNPTFNFTASIDDRSFFNPQSAQVDPTTQYSTWQQQNPRSLGSITNSTSSPQTPIPGPFSIPTMARPPLQQRQDNNVDPNLHTSMLSVPPVGRSRSPLDQANTVDPLYNPVYSSSMHDEPWSSVRMRNTSLPSNNSGRLSAYAQTDVNYGPYRDTGGRPASDLDSTAPRSDSGYFTHQAHSVRSNEPDRIDQELSASMTFGVHNLNVNPQVAPPLSTTTSSEPTEVMYMQCDQTSQYSGRSAAHSHGPGPASGQGRTSFKCQRCNEISKCPSDFKKHMLKHEKPYVCDVQGCRRAAVGKGFTTKNDLDRHKKSVHRVGVEKDSYQCASENCRNRCKIWPRLDNFKQHISRMHKDEDEPDLIRRSAYQGPYPPPTGESISVALLDTTLAGICTEKQFGGGGNESYDDPASGINLTPDQDSDRFFGGAFDPTAHEFALDVDRTKQASSGSNDVLDYGFSAASIQQGVTGNGRSRKRRQDSLSVLADVAGSVGSGLSSAPQTKAEQQQRQALQKFSKAIMGELQNAPSANGVDLENIVLRMLQGATNQGHRASISEDSVDSHDASSGSAIDIVMTKAEALKASQAISNLIKRSSISQSTPRSRRSSKATSSNGIRCEECDATLPRSCDMKKHMKRHTRPYGCTYPQCFKRFGAKSDWKRHENSQHFQLEAFLCDHPLPCLTPSTSAPTPCNKIFYRADLFRSHLARDHQVSDTACIEKKVRDRRIGKNGQGQFWCGFCERIVKLKEKRNDAWDERFNHIDAHFSKEDKRIDEWVCVEAGKCKGSLLKDIDRSNFDDEEGDEDRDAEGTSEENSPPPAVNFDITSEEPDQSLRTMSAARVYFPEPAVDFHPLRKRQFPMDDAMSTPVKRRRRGEINQYCCTCHGGPWPVHSYVDCVSCSHHLCSSCTIVDSLEGLESSMLS